MRLFFLCCSGHRGRKQNTEKEKDETKSSVSKEIKPSEKSKASVLASRSSNSAPISKKLNKQRTCSEETHQSRDSESQKGCDNKECSSSGSKHASQGTNLQAKGSDFKETTSTDSKKVSEKQCSSVANKDLSPLKEKPSKDASKQRNPKNVKKQNQKLVIKSKAELPSDEEFEAPTMSFESYLNYDQVTKKRKRKACPTSKFSHAKKGEEDVKKCEDDQSETPNKKVNHCMVEIIANKLQMNKCSCLLFSVKFSCIYFKQQIARLWRISCIGIANNYNNWGKKKMISCILAVYNRLVLYF